MCCLKFNNGISNEYNVIVIKINAFTLLVSHVDAWWNILVF